MKATPPERLQAAKERVENATGDLKAAEGLRNLEIRSAKAAGLSLRAIGTAVGLHFTRVDQILRGE